MNPTDKGLLLILHYGGRGGWRQIVRQAFQLASEVGRDQMTRNRNNRLPEWMERGLLRVEIGICRYYLQIHCIRAHRHHRLVRMTLQRIRS